MTVCMHFAAATRAATGCDGGYEPVAEVLFQRVRHRGYFLEYDSSRAGDFSPLRFVPKGQDGRP